MQVKPGGTSSVIKGIVVRTLGLRKPGRLDSGEPDAWTLDNGTFYVSMLGLWMRGRLDSGRLNAWTLNALALGLWILGRLDSGRLDAWAQDAWTLDGWMLGLWMPGHLDKRLTFNNCTFATDEILQLKTLIFSYRNLFERMYICNCSLAIERRPFNGWMTVTVVARLTQNLWKKGWL